MLDSSLNISFSKYPHDSQSQETLWFERKKISSSSKCSQMLNGVQKFSHNSIFSTCVLLLLLSEKEEEKSKLMTVLWFKTKKRKNMQRKLLSIQIR